MSGGLMMMMMMMMSCRKQHVSFVHCCRRGHDLPLALDDVSRNQQRVNSVVAMTSLRSIWSVNRCWRRCVTRDIRRLHSDWQTRRGQSDDDDHSWPCQQRCCFCCCCCRRYISWHRWSIPDSFITQRGPATPTGCPGTYYRPELLLIIVLLPGASTSLHFHFHLTRLVSDPPKHGLGGRVVTRDCNIIFIFIHLNGSKER